MASKYRSWVSRCSLAACNLNILRSRSSSHVSGIRRQACTSVKKKSLCSENITNGGCLTSTRFPPVAVCHREHSTLSRGMYSNLGFKRAVDQLPDFLSVLGFRDAVVGCPSRRMAGHAHWQNVRHIKGAKDSQKAAVASKTMSNIMVAVKAGGGDPKLNRQLAKVLDAGLQQGVQKTRLNEMLEKAITKSKSYQRQYCYALGPQGCVFIVEVFTDNVTRTRNQLTGVVKKAGGQIINESGRQGFEEKGIIEVTVTADMEPVDMDKYLEVAIETGAEDVILTEEEDEEGKQKKILKFHCNPTHVNSVKKQIEDNNLEVSSAESDFVPLHWVTLQGPELTVAQTIYEKINDHEEVVKIFDNINTPDE